MPELLIATGNPGKFEEIRSFLRPRHPHVLFRSITDVKGMPKVEEDGSTFTENARKKAKLLSTFSGLPTLADDSGLEVEALGGRPGVLSARFAGPKATDEENNRKLLDKLVGNPPENRGARFRCVMVLYAPNGQSAMATGDLAGTILEASRGVSGFGYDPLFLVPALGRTLAEMTLSEKNRISHRARALQKISELLEEFLAKT